MNRKWIKARARGREARCAGRSAAHYAFVFSKGKWKILKIESFFPGQDVAGASWHTFYFPTQP